MSQSANGSSLRGGYEDVDQLDDVTEQGHVRAVISQRRGHSKYTAAFFKVFQRDGQEERTAFFEPDRHFDGLLRLLPLVRKRIADLESKPMSVGRRF
jgi:hypothetical protein